MKLKKDSLLFKTILFNDLSMLLTGLTIVGLVVVFVFKELEKNFSIKAVEKFHVIENMLHIKNNEFIVELTKFTNSNEFLDGNIFSDKTRTESENKEIYKTLKSKLVSKNFSLYHEADLIILGKNGEFLDSKGIEKSVSREDVVKMKALKSKLNLTIDSMIYHKENKTFYYEIMIPIEKNNDVDSILVEIPIDSNYFMENKYLMVVDHNHIDEIGIYKDNKDMNMMQSKKGRLEKEERKINFNSKEYTVKTLKIKRIDHNIVSCPIYNYSGEEIGKLMVSIAEPALAAFKLNTMIVIILATIILILINSFIITGTFKQLLYPLEELAESVEDIAEGNLDRNLRLTGTREMKTLSLATRKMVEKLKNNTQESEGQNEKLKNYIKKVEGVEKLLLRIRQEQTNETGIDILLDGFACKDGLNYDRAIFLKYSDEDGCLIGRKIKKNRNIVKEDELSSFDLRYETMKEILPLIKIANDDNIFTRAVKERKIVYENRKGYQIYLGSEILRGFGIGNFMVIPIYKTGKNHGCILVDNYISGRRIEAEDVELFNMIIINIGIHYENKDLAEAKMKSERDVAIGRMFRKIINRRNKVIEKYTTMVLELREKNQIDNNRFDEFRNIICSINREDSILFDYSGKKEYNFEKLEINKFLTDVVDSYVKCNPNRDLSLFLDEDGEFLGDFVELTKALREIINNGLNAIEGVPNGRINIVSKVKKDNITIKIYDNGIGISKKFLEENIFEPFASGTEEKSGLGLAIANKIVESHHGGILKIDSKLGEGTEVKIILNRYKEDINV